MWFEGDHLPFPSWPVFQGCNKQVVTIPPCREGGGGDPRLGTVAGVILCAAQARLCSAVSSSSSCVCTAGPSWQGAQSKHFFFFLPCWSRVERQRITNLELVFQTRLRGWSCCLCPCLVPLPPACLYHTAGEPPLFHALLGEAITSACLHGI